MPSEVTLPEPSEAHALTGHPDAPRQTDGHGHDPHHGQGHGAHGGHKKSARRPGWLRPVGIIVLIAAGGAATYGIMNRRSSDKSLAEATNEMAIPSVEVARPILSTESQALVLPGTLAAYHEAQIFARVNGYMASWTKDIGATVKAGETIATIDTPDLDQELAQAQADLASAKANLSLAELTSKRWRALLSSSSVSVQSVDEKEGSAMAQRALVNAQQAKVDRLLTLTAFKRLTAPFDGIITARTTDVGALINSGSNAAKPLFKVADTHEMRVYVSVPQSYASQLTIGMTATLSQPQYPGVSFPATLVTTSQSATSDSRTVLAQLKAENPDGKLWEGTYARVAFNVPGHSGVLAVPAGALIFRAQGAQIAVASKNGEITLKDVTIGRNFGSTIEILAGLEPTDNVVISHLDTISHGQKVVVTEAPETGVKTANVPVKPAATKND
jgi:RND family efflux transporter MFP subunit